MFTISLFYGSHINVLHQKQGLSQTGLANLLIGHVAL